MNNQLAVIANGILNLPSNIAKTLETVKTFPSVSSESPSDEVKTRITPLPELNQTMYPNVGHWGSGAYLSMRKKHKGGGGSDINILGGVYSCYMEDENGSPIPDSERGAARTRARSFWWKLHNRGVAPQKCGEVDSDIANEYIAFMEEGFPWLRYCKNHWKAMQIWHNHYSSWNNDRKGELENARPASEANAEGDVIDIDANEDDNQDVQSTHQKRPQADDNTSASKRRRVREEDSTRPKTPRTVLTKRSKVRLPSLFNYKCANMAKQGIL